MPLNFPSNPTIGQESTQNGRTYNWTGSAWELSSEIPTPAVSSVAGRTGDIVLSKIDVGLTNVNNTSDLNKPISTPTQAALDNKAPLANPTFTGVVSGITKGMVGLDNVDNTSDISKPVSTAQAAADSAVQTAAATDATTKANTAQTAAATDATTKSNAAQAYAIQRSNHTGAQVISTVTGLQTELDNKQPIGSYLTPSSLDSEISTDLVAGIGIALAYDNVNDDLSISTNGLTPILSRGLLAGTNTINYGADRTIQTITLDGRATTFTKGTGWPTTSLSCDVLLKITTTAITSITWTVITDWFNQPPAGALTVGTHLVLLRAIGSTIIEGHYIGNKTN